MLAELRTKSQITLPKDIVKALGLSEGDKLDVFERDGIIYMRPVAVYPKDYVKSLHNEIEQLKEDIRSGKQPTFDSVDAFIAELEEDQCLN